MTEPAPIGVIDCPVCGGGTPILRSPGSPYELFCGECGLDQAGLVAGVVEDTSPSLADVPLGDLAAELKARTDCSPDLGLCEQVCPRCSSTKKEVLGTWSRREQLFTCGHCNVSLYGDRYEEALSEYYRVCWRARGERLRIKKLLAAHT